MQYLPRFFTDFFIFAKSGDKGMNSKGFTRKNENHSEKHSESSVSHNTLKVSPEYVILLIEYEQTWWVSDSSTWFSLLTLKGSDFFQKCRCSGKNWTLFLIWHRLNIFFTLTPSWMLPKIPPCWWQKCVWYIFTFLVLQYIQGAGKYKLCFFDGSSWWKCGQKWRQAGYNFLHLIWL